MSMILKQLIRKKYVSDFKNYHLRRRHYQNSCWDKPEILTNPECFLRR